MPTNLLEKQPANLLVSKEDNAVIRQAPDPTIFDKVKSFFRDEKREIADSMNIYALSKVTGLSLKETNDNYHWLKRSSKITGLTPQLERREYTALVMTPFIAAGAIANPVGTAVGLLSFGALNKIVPTDKWLDDYERTNGPIQEDVRTSIELADFIAKGAMARGILKKSPKMVESFVKQKLIEYKLPRTVELTPKQIADVFQTGKLTTAEQKSLFGGLGLSRQQLKTAISKGIKIEVPAEKIVTVSDKPFWGRVKEIFKIQPAVVKTTSQIAGQPKQAPAGLIEAPAPVFPQVGVPSASPATATEAVVSIPKFTGNNTADAYGRSIQGDVEKVNQLSKHVAEMKQRNVDLMKKYDEVSLEEADAIELEINDLTWQISLADDALKIAKEPLTATEAKTLTSVERDIGIEWFKGKSIEAAKKVEDAKKELSKKGYTFDVDKGDDLGITVVLKDGQEIEMETGDSLVDKFYEEQLSLVEYNEKINALLGGGDVSPMESAGIRAEAERRTGLTAEQAVKQGATTTAPAPTTQELIAKVKSLQSEKELSNVTVSRLKKYLGIENIKKAESEQLEKLVEYLDKFEKGDKLLSETQLEGLKDIIKDLPEPEVTPKRIVIDQFGEQEEILSKGIPGKIANELLPTVDIKENHPLIEKIVNNATVLMTHAESEVSRRDQKLDKMLTLAEKSRKRPLKEKLASQNKEIFLALSGGEVDLTKEEVATLAYLKNFFKKVRNDLQLDKYRKNYVTHLEKSLTEKILDEGLLPAIKDILKGDKELNIPVNLMLELDNIIGSEKFFKFALERKGGISPSKNLRRIVHAYSNLYETKKALDQILPEGQAVTKLLLKNRSAQWMKRFLQNLKGRGLDQDFKTGKMAWLSKTADAIVDLGYLKLLGLNYKSALKNIIAGEANSWIYQDFPKYLEGKKRFFGNPKRAIEMASRYGILDGMFYEYAQKGIGKLKKIQDMAMIGQQIGEYEIRASLFASDLTKEEWESGEISKERMLELGDMIAITQGKFSKIDSPLFLQTWYGRMWAQMNRWRITNAMLLNRLAKGASSEFKQGNYTGPYGQKLGKAFIAWGIATYLYAELSRAGYDTAAKVAKSMGETINNTIELATLGPILESISNNPTISLLKEIAFTIQENANYIAPYIIEEPRSIEFQQGIEDTYIAPKENLADLIEAMEDF